MYGFPQVSRRRRIFQAGLGIDGGHMRKTMVLLGLLGALVLAGAAEPKVTTVAVTKSGFVPDAVKIGVGDSVTWQNTDTVPHQLVSPQAGIQLQTLQPGATYTFAFLKAGSFTVQDPTAKGKAARSSVAVAAAPTTITLAAAPTLVVYGGKATLSGVIANLQQGDQVSLMERACGATAASRASAVTPTSAGAFSAVVQPLRNTAYTIQTKTVTSAPVTVLAKPRLAFRKVAARRFTLTVSASTSLSGRAVVLQRYDPVRKAWRAVKSAILVRGAAATAPTVLSKASFTARVKPRTKLRAALTQVQAGSCYRAANSNVVLG